MGRMTTICITGSTDGIGRATAEVLAGAGHRVLVHARNRDRGRQVVDELGGDVELVTGDLASLAEVRRLAEQIRAAGPLDVLVHNAGVWVRNGTPKRSADGFETTFAVNVLAPHLLTALLADDLRGRAGARLVWLGSGMAGSGRPDAADPGRATDASRAYSDSKASDVALAGAWGRRLPAVGSAALDPGWVKTKLATAGAPGTVASSATALAALCTEADLSRGLYWKGRSPVTVPSRVRDPSFQDRLAETCDRLAGC